MSHKGVPLTFENLGKGGGKWRGWKEGKRSLYSLFKPQMPVKAGIVLEWEPRAKDNPGVSLVTGIHLI